MAAPRKEAMRTSAGKSLSPNARLAKRHSVPSGREEKHMGATENQVSVTMPPRDDNDEPKQG